MLQGLFVGRRRQQADPRHRLGDQRVIGRRIRQPAQLHTAARGQLERSGARPVGQFSQGLQLRRSARRRAAGSAPAQRRQRPVDLQGAGAGVVVAAALHPFTVRAATRVPHYACRDRAGHSVRAVGNRGER